MPGDWPQQIARRRVLGNFKRPVLERRRKMPSAADRREGNDVEHRRLVKLLPCLVTGRHGPNDAHHLKSGLSSERGIGRKSTDRWLVPLCREAHDELERLGARNEIAWFRSYGIHDPHEVAHALWNARGDVARMTKIAVAARSGK